MKKEALFSRINEYGRPQVTFYRGPQGDLISNVHVIRSFFQDIGGC